MSLNYHHLRYFHEVAKEGNLTRVATRLRVAPSALSSQIRQLEASLGPLFVREGRSLVLTEAGKIALAHAETIFGTGDDLVRTLSEGRSERAVLSVGASSTLSRNFQEAFLSPLFHEKGAHVRLVSGGLDDLLQRLVARELDVVLASGAVQRGRGLRCRRLARQQASLIGHPRQKRFRFPDDLGRVRLVLPSPSHALRSEFDALCARLGVEVTPWFEVDDMAMARLLVRDADAVGLLPPVVVRDELGAGILRELAVVPDLFEDFYAVTLARKYEHPLLRKLFLEKPLA